MQSASRDFRGSGVADCHGLSRIGSSRMTRTDTDQKTEKSVSLSACPDRGFSASIPRPACVQSIPSSRIRRRRTAIGRTERNPCPSVLVRDGFFVSIRDLPVSSIVTDSTRPSKTKIRVLPCSSVTGLLRVHPRPRLVFSRSHRHGFDTSERRSKNRKKIRVLPCSSVTGLLRVHPRPRPVFSRSHVTDSTPANSDLNRKKIRVLPCSSVTGLIGVDPRPGLLCLLRGGVVSRGCS